MKYRKALAILTFALLLTACTLGAPPPQNRAPSLPEAGEAPTTSETAVPQETAAAPAGSVVVGTPFIEQVDVLLMESFPLQAAAVVRGNLPDACTTISGVDVVRKDNLFEVTLSTERPADAVCAQVLTPFEENVPLDIVGLPAGTYTVNVNGVQTTFTLAMDNAMPTEIPTPTAVAVVSPTAQPSPTPTATPEPQEETCTNRITFMGENVPDGTSFAAGNTFEKTWTLKNEGTCTWTQDYAAVFVDGDQMGAQSPVPLPKEVAPGQKVTIRVPFTAPQTPGTYRSVWRLQTPDGVQFGPGKKGEGQFWVEIQVTEASSSLNLGAPTWSDPMDKSTYWFLVDTDNTRFKMNAGALEMIAKTKGVLDEWGLSQRAAVDDFYLEVDFTTGDVCSGLDRYGMIVRAPSPEKGYVFGVSCDGRFRLYLWDGSTYTSLQDWKAHPAIRTGPNQKNTLGIWVKGNKFKVYVNGQLVGSVRDATFKDGQFGLFIASGENAPFKVRVEEARFWDLTP